MPRRLDRRREDVDRLVETAARGPSGDSTDRRVQPRFPEDLVGVEVADAGQECLVEQERFQAAAPPLANRSRSRSSISSGSGRGARRGRRPGRRPRAGRSAELAWVDEVERQPSSKVTVRWVWAAIGRSVVRRTRLPAHFAVEHEVRLAGEADNHVLASPGDRLDGPADGGLRQHFDRGVRAIRGQSSEPTARSGGRAGARAGHGRWFRPRVALARQASAGRAMGWPAGSSRCRGRQTGP